MPLILGGAALRKATSTGEPCASRIMAWSQIASSIHQTLSLVYEKSQDLCRESKRHWGRRKGCGRRAPIVFPTTHTLEGTSSFSSAMHWLSKNQSESYAALNTLGHPSWQSSYITNNKHTANVERQKFLGELSKQSGSDTGVLNPLQELIFYSIPQDESNAYRKRYHRLIT